MNKLMQAQVLKIDGWMKQNARPYDLAKWNFLFGKGTKEDIVTELLKYQNEDGGFGNGLEADILLPHSSAISTAEAIFQAYEYGLDCTAEWFSKKMLKYFENTVQDIPKYWEDMPKEVIDYPHAPWWGYDVHAKFSPNPCAVVASALILYGTDKQKALGEKIAKKCFELLLGEDFCGDHDCYNIMALIEKTGIKDDNIISAMKRRIAENVCYEKDRWSEYVAQPLDFVFGPDSMWYECVKEGVPANFDYWLENINEQGVWEPNFSWGQDTDISKQVTKNWTGYLAVKRVKIFMNYGLI